MSWVWCCWAVVFIIWYSVVVVVWVYAVCYAVVVVVWESFVYVSVAVVVYTVAYLVGGWVYEFVFIVTVSVDWGVTFW